MRQTRLGSWLLKGTLGQRFAKEFAFHSIVTMIAWCCLFYANRVVGPRVFTDAPFVSEDFWVTCGSFGLGYAIVTATSSTKIRKNRTMAE